MSKPTHPMKETPAGYSRHQSDLDDEPEDETVWIEEHNEALARIAELEAERNAAFAMSKCECGADEACANLARMQARIAELEAAQPPEGWPSWEDWLAGRGVEIHRKPGYWAVRSERLLGEDIFSTYPAALQAAIKEAGDDTE